MGRVAVKTKIWNFEDELRAIRGQIPKEAIRTIEVEGLIDTGATILVLPEELVDRLGLLIDREMTVTCANNSRAKKKVATGARIEILGRVAMVDCIVEEPGARVLIGQVPLEVMDLVVDPKQGTIGPRPESPDMPLIELYLTKSTSTIQPLIHAD
jgi:clan AA aspartic protease